MSLDLTDDKSILVQVMAWCRQATSHYLSQCWPRSLLPYEVTRPQWINVWYELEVEKYYRWLVNMNMNIMKEARKWFCRNTMHAGQMEDQTLSFAYHFTCLNVSFTELNVFYQLWNLIWQKLIQPLKGPHTTKPVVLKWAHDWNLMKILFTQTSLLIIQSGAPFT